MKTKGKYKIKKDTPPAGGGQCLMDPPEIVDGKFPVILYNIGGSLTNFVVSIIFLILSYYNRENHFVFTILIFSAIAGFLVGVYNIVPIKSTSSGNDTKNLYNILKYDNAYKPFWVMLKTHKFKNDEIFIRDMPNDMFYEPSSTDLQNHVASSMAYFYSMWLFNHHNFKEARNSIINVIEEENLLPELYKRMLINELIYCDLLFRDFEEIDYLLDERQLNFSKKFKNDPSILRVEYLLAYLYHKDMDNANELYKRFEKASSKYTYQYLIDEEHYLIDIAKQPKTIIE